MVHFYSSENELTTATCMDIGDAQKHNVRGEKSCKILQYDTTYIKFKNKSLHTNVVKLYRKQGRIIIRRGVTWNGVEWRGESIHQEVTKGCLDGAARGDGFTGIHSLICFMPCMQSHSLLCICF